MTFKTETDNTKVIKTIISKGFKYKHTNTVMIPLSFIRFWIQRRELRVYNSEELIMPLSEYKKFLLNSSY
jgi:hypothetical protein